MIIMNDMSKNNYARVTIALPKELLQRVDKYCEKVVPGGPKIRSAVIRQAIERFLKEKGDTQLSQGNGSGNGGNVRKRQEQLYQHKVASMG